MLLTLDSSVIVAGLRNTEPRHKQCSELLQKVRTGEHIGVCPLTVFVEVVAAIRRRTGSETLAEQTAAHIQSWGIDFVGMDVGRSIRATAIAIRTGLRGMDAIVVQVAQEFDCPLVSLDEEMLSHARELVEVMTIDEF